MNGLNKQLFHFTAGSGTGTGTSTGTGTMTGGTTSKLFLWFVLFGLFGLLLNVPINSCGHVGDFASI